MTHIRYHKIDRQFGTLLADTPGGKMTPVDPLDGITFGFFIQGTYPAVYYGTVEGDVQDNPVIGLTVITEAEYEAARDEEIIARQPTREQVNEERDRRIAEGAVVALTGYGDIRLQGRPVDQINTLALKDTARDLNAAGVTDPIIPFRDGDNVTHMLTPAQTMQMADLGKTVASQIYQASWAIKAMDPIPDDYADDSRWP